MMTSNDMGLLVVVAMSLFAGIMVVAAWINHLARKHSQEICGECEGCGCPLTLETFGTDDDGIELCPGCLATCEKLPEEEP